jgi:hypothetical protein
MGIRNNDFDYFLKLVQPYRHDLTVCAECMFKPSLTPNAWWPR